MNLIEATNYYLGEGQGGVITGNKPFLYYINPTLEEAQLIKDRDPEQTIRYLIPPDNLIYMWPASYAIHGEFAHKMGIILESCTKGIIEPDEDLRIEFDGINKFRDEQVALSKSLGMDRPKGRKSELERIFGKGYTDPYET